MVIGYRYFAENKKLPILPIKFPAQGNIILSSEH